MQLSCLKILLWFVWEQNVFAFWYLTSVIGCWEFVLLVKFSHQIRHLSHFHGTLLFACENHHAAALKAECNSGDGSDCSALLLNNKWDHSRITMVQLRAEHGA